MQVTVLAALIELSLTHLSHWPSPFPPNIGINFTFYSMFFSSITPQQELKVELDCSEAIDVYVINAVYNLMDNFRDVEHNVALLEEFLQTNPDVIGWHGKDIEGSCRLYSN